MRSISRFSCLFDKGVIFYFFQRAKYLDFDISIHWRRSVHFNLRSPYFIIYGEATNFYFATDTVPAHACAQVCAKNPEAVYPAAPEPHTSTNIFCT